MLNSPAHSSPADALSADDFSADDLGADDLTTDLTNPRLVPRATHRHRFYFLLTALALGASVLRARVAQADDAELARPAPSSNEVSGHSQAAQQSPARILLIAEAVEPALSRRIAAELLSLGFSVELPQAELSMGTRAELEEATRQAEAAASLRIVQTADGYDVWVSDRVTGKTSIRTLRVDETDDALIAVRAVELLRASLLELSSSDTPEGEVPPPTAALELVEGEPRAKLFAYGELGGGAWLSAGGFPPSWSSRIAVGLGFSSWISLQATVGVGLNRASLSTEYGTASLRPTSVALGPRFTMVRLGDWRIDSGFDVTLLWLQSSGDDASASSANGASPSLGGQLGIGWQPSPLFGLTLDGTLGAATRRISVQADGTEVATWGLPHGLITLGVRFEFR